MHVKGVLKPTSNRYDEWKQVFGSEPIALDKTTLTGAECYAIDPHALTLRQIGALSAHLSKRWKIPASEVPKKLLEGSKKVYVKVEDVLTVAENATLF